MAEKSNFIKPEYFYNRELSWISFNYRVLSEAQDKERPLFDRMGFLAITASNLDEFFMIRVASLKDMVQVNYTKKDIAGMTPVEQLAAISGKTHQLVKDQYNIYNYEVIPDLLNNGLKIISYYEDLNNEQAKYVDSFFQSEVFPVLTPMAVDSSRPFPLIRNKTLNIGAVIKIKPGSGKEGNTQFRELYMSHYNKRNRTVTQEVLILQQYKSLLYCHVL